MSSPESRIKIRCPNCQMDGTARAELLNRRVTCKHCSHVFRVFPVDEPITAPPAGMSVSSASAIVPGSPAVEASGKRSKERAEALEREIRKLRDDLSAEHTAADEAQALRTQLNQATEAVRKAEAREASLRKELDQLRDQLDQTIETTGDETKNSRLEEELRFLREQIDKARSEADAEARRRRDVAATLTAKTAEHAQALAAKEAEHAQALTAKVAEHAQTLTAKEAEHAQSVRTLQQKLEDVQTDARAIEGRRQADNQARIEAETRATTDVGSIREEHQRSLRELDEAKKALETLRSERDRALAEQSQGLEELKGKLSQLEAKLGEAEATRTHRDQLAREMETLQKRLSDSERQILEHKDGHEATRLDRDRIEAARLAEVSDLRDQLNRALASSADAAILRQELDEVRPDRDRLAGELEALRAKAAEVELREADWGYPSTELDIPHHADPDETRAPGRLDDESTVFDSGMEKLQRETDSLRAELAELTDRLGEKEAEVSELTGRAQTETKDLRRELYEARLEAETASKAKQELADRLRDLEAAPAPATIVPAVPAVDPSVFETERSAAVAEAVKGAWADFERRLAETQAKLKAANTRADLMELAAREARDQLAGREGGGDDSEFGGEVAAVTSVRILEARGTARITPADAEARLALARQLAVERKDKTLIDRISKMTEKVKGDLEARNYTLAETLVRGAEIETGLDPGGFSINGLRIFRASPTIVGSLTALAPSFDRVMRDGDIEAIRTTIDEMKTILGDQAGLPEIRRPGRTPATKRPIATPEAFRLFIDALIGENWLIRPVVQKKPLPDTSLSTYAGLIEACCVARTAAETIDPEQQSLLDDIIQACCLMLTRRQQADGHFSFLDPRGKASKISTVVDGMVAQRSDAVKDGWVVHVDPIGLAQVETGACGVALATAGRTLNRINWVQASQKAAEWAVGQPCLPNFVANAASAGLLARSYIDSQQDPHLVGLVRKLSMGLLPGQTENGRWVDPTSATTANHLLILRALHDAWEAIPDDHKEIRKDLKAGIKPAMAGLLEECKALGAPPQGGALRDLIRHRDLFPAERDPRLDPAILDSATVIQELCHDGPKRKLGVAADQLAALILL